MTSLTLIVCPECHRIKHHNLWERIISLDYFIKLLHTNGDINVTILWHLCPACHLIHEIDQDLS